MKTPEVSPPEIRKNTCPDCGDAKGTGPEHCQPCSRERMKVKYQKATLRQAKEARADQRSEEKRTQVVRDLKIKGLITTGEPDDSNSGAAQKKDNQPNLPFEQ